MRSRLKRRSWSQHNVPVVKAVAAPPTYVAIALRAARQSFDEEGHMCGIIVLRTISNLALSRKRGLVNNIRARHAQWQLETSWWPAGLQRLH